MKKMYLVCPPPPPPPSRRARCRVSSRCLSQRCRLDITMTWSVAPPPSVARDAGCSRPPRATVHTHTHHQNRAVTRARHSVPPVSSASGRCGAAVATGPHSLAGGSGRLPTRVIVSSTVGRSPQPGWRKRAVQVHTHTPFVIVISSTTHRRA